jgi:hypothetical protein
VQRCGELQRVSSTQVVDTHDAPGNSADRVDGLDDVPRFRERIQAPESFIDDDRRNRAAPFPASECRRALDLSRPPYDHLRIALVHSLDR